MSALCFIHEIVEHDNKFEDIFNSVDLVFIPVDNPKGYTTDSF